MPLRLGALWVLLYLSASCISGGMPSFGGSRGVFVHAQDNEGHGSSSSDSSNATRVLLTAGGGEEEEGVYAKQPLIFIKTPKCGGSTAGGVFRHVAATNGMSGATRDYPDTSKAPFVFAHHNNLRDVNQYIRRYTTTHAREPFYVSIVRNPAERAVSMYYHFAVSRGGKTSSTDAMIAAFEKEKMWNVMSRYLSPSGTSVSVPSIMETYDLIMVTERFDESLLVFRALYGVSLTSVLYVPSKVSSEERKDDIGKVQVKHPDYKDLPKELLDFFAGTLWQNANAKDYALFEQANLFLDAAISKHATIEGKPFSDALHMFQDWQTRVYAECSINNYVHGQTDAVVPASVKKCYWRDNGCGYECIRNWVANNVDQ
jgi:hypothetical protein